MEFSDAVLLHKPVDHLELASHLRERCACCCNASRGNRIV
jgi:translation initiation factor 1 (eIF-1/SUI1)